MRTDFGGPYGGPAYQLFYSRRIGRGTPSASLGNDQSIVFQPSSVPVIGAAKVTGTVGGASVGVLTAVEPRVSAQVETAGRVGDLRVAEARSTSALRVRAPVAKGVLIGVSGTAVDPFLTDAALGLTRRHAHVGEADLTLFNDDRSWDFTAQGVGSLVTGREPETLRDGTFADRTASGFAGSTRLGHETEHTAFAVFFDALTPNFTVNDLGYVPRANLTRAMGYFALRDPHPNSWRQNIQLLFGAREVRDARFANLLERDALLELNFSTNSFWFVDAGMLGQTAYVDDRELLDGTPLERQPGVAAFGFISTDSRKPLQLQFGFTQSRSFPRFERQNQLEVTAIFRPLPQLEGNFDVSYNENAGTFRQIRGATLEGSTAVLDAGASTKTTRLYLLAEQQARSVSATLRGTYAFTPHLTLQAYAQLFTAGVTYGAAQRALVAPGKATVRLDDLRPALSQDRPPNADDRQAGLNLNLILRWEWRTGSTLYLVYAHQSANDVTPPLRGLDFGRELSALASSGVSHGDTLLVKADLLTTL